MIKLVSAFIRYILSRMEIINPTNVTKAEMINELRIEFQEELAEMKRVK